MTLIEAIIAAFVIADIILDGCILLELREQRMTRTIRESQRRQWVKKEHEDG